MSDEQKSRVDAVLVSASDLVLNALKGVEAALDHGGESAARKMIAGLRDLHNTKPWNVKP